MPKNKTTIPMAKWALSLPVELNEKVERYAEELEQEKQVPISKKYVLVEILKKFFDERENEQKK